ncbi:VQ - like 3 [Theobroma cacao]|nr:VQ - like 3 [Theobroma cacao]
MGKKIISQVQVKISKKTTSEKKQLNSLIKVLRPKVFITDSSSFKSLVQDLTGNGNSSVSQLLPSPQIVEEVPPAVIDVEDNHGNPESSMESSIDIAASLESFQVCNHLALTEEVNQAYDPMRFDDTISSEHLLMNVRQEEYSLGYGDLQSLLLDVDEQLYPYSFNVYPQIQQEVSIYDYELSGLL